MGYKARFIARGIEYEETFASKLKKALYDLRRHPWDNTYIRSLNIT